VNTHAPRWAFALLVGAGVAMFAAALFVGSVPLGVGDVWRALWQPDGSAVDTVVRQLRLPRALTAFAVGGLLALSGALLQALLRNPLADPYVLGISGGAAVAALVAMAAGASLAVVQGRASLARSPRSACCSCWHGARCSAARRCMPSRRPPACC
jgi:iron complex transport system permease protein